MRRPTEIVTTRYALLFAIYVPPIVVPTFSSMPKPGRNIICPIGTPSQMDQSLGSANSRYPQISSTPFRYWWLSPKKYGFRRWRRSMVLQKTPPELPPFDPAISLTLWCQSLLIASMAIYKKEILRHPPFSVITLDRTCWFVGIVIFWEGRNILFSVSTVMSLYPLIVEKEGTNSFSLFLPLVCHCWEGRNILFHILPRCLFIFPLVLPTDIRALV